MVHPPLSDLVLMFSLPALEPLLTRTSRPITAGSLSVNLRVATRCHCLLLPLGVGQVLLKAFVQWSHRLLLRGSLVQLGWLQTVDTYRYCTK